MDNYTKLWIDMDADELQTWECEVTRRLEDAKAEVTTQEQALAAIRTELARRKIAAFWRANEGLRLEVGDKITITIEYIAWYMSNPAHKLSGVWEDQIFTITDLYPTDGGGISIHTNGIHLMYVPLDIARRMRIAYLQAHGEAQG